MKSGQVNKRILYIIDILLLVLTVSSDRFTKYLTLNKLKGHPSRSIINGILEFRYLENSGAAFGLLKNQQSFFVLVEIITLIAICYVIIKSSPLKKTIPQNICLVIIAGGSIGNFIDRILFGYVIDFIYISSINFPVFNLADFYISISTIVLIILMLFYYKEHDLLYLEVKERKLRNINK